MRANLPRSAAACPEPRYTKIPDQIANLELTPREEQLVHRLLSHRWTPDAQMYPSIKRLAELMHCTRRTVQRTLRRLEGRGLLVTEANYRVDAGQQSNTYHLAGALLAIVASAVDQPVARPVDDRRRGATPVAGKRDSGKQSKANQKQSMGGYKQPPTDVEAFFRGGLIRRS